MEKKMSNMKYVIRHQSFGYNDEWYCLDWAMQGAIKAVYSDKVEAEQQYKKLIVHALYQDDFYNFSIANGEATEEQYAQIEAFILEKTGEEFDNESIPEMNEDDAFEFAKLSGILHFQLIEVDDSLPNYVIFNPTTNRYVYASTPEESVLLTGNTEQFLFDMNNYIDDYWQEETVNQFFDDLNLEQKGTLEELSDAPALLEQFIKENSWLSYENQGLKIENDADEDTFNRIKSLNALLKQPIFEIRQVTLEQLATLG